MRFVFVALTLWAAACKTSEASGRGDAGASVGRGSNACRDWQDAICDYAVDRCGATVAPGLTRKQCDDQYQGATCKSDAAALRCANQIDDAACGRAPDTCSLDAIADPGPAARACDDLYDRFCERSVACGVSSSLDACRASPEVSAIDCGKAIAFGLGYEDCFDQVQNLDCEILLLPDICDSVITLRK